MTLHLLRRHVADGAEDGPGSGLVRAVGDGVGLMVHRLIDAGEPEVEHLDPTVGGQKDVRRLEVAVHDAGLVGCSEAVGY